MASFGQAPMVEVLLQIWRRRGWVASMIFVLVLTAGFSLIKALPHLYGASTTLVIEQPSEPGFLAKRASSDDPEKRLQIAEQYVFSRAHLESLVRKFDLYPRLTRLDDDEILLARARKDIHIQKKDVLRKWGEDQMMVVEISYQGWQPQIAADVANAIATDLTDADRKSRLTQAARTTAFLKMQLDETRQQVKRREESIEAFRKQYIGQLPEQQGINLTKLQRLGDELRDNRDAQMKLMEQRSDVPAGASDTGSLQDRLTLLERRYNTLRMTYTDKFPEVARLKEQIADLKGRMKQGGSSDTVATSLASATPGMDVLRKQEQQLRNQIAGLESKLGSAPLMEYELKQRNRDYEAIRDHYFELMKQYNQARLSQSLENEPGRAFRVLESAIPIDMPKGPKKLHLLVLAVMGALGAAGAVTLLLEQMDDSFHSLRALKTFCTVPVLASIPLVTTRQDIVKKRNRRLVMLTVWLIGCVSVAGLGYYVGEGSRQLTWMLGHI